jgi:hypothetical protein
MLYTVTCTRRAKPFRRQGVYGAFEGCYKMAAAARLRAPSGG